jgi:MFS family permease
LFCRLTAAMTFRGIGTFVLPFEAYYELTAGPGDGDPSAGDHQAARATQGRWEFGASVIVVVGEILFYGPAQAFVAELAPPGRQGSYLGIWGSTGGLSTLIAAAAGPDIEEEACTRTSRRRSRRSGELTRSAQQKPAVARGTQAGS